MGRTIRTTNQDIYINRVENAASQEGRDVDSSEYTFKYQYELFSFGLVVGYLEGQQAKIEEEDGFSQEILRLSQLDNNHEHRVSIELINQLVLMEADKDYLEVLGEDYESRADITEPEDVWPIVLRYADWGVKYIDDRVATQEDLDLVGLVRDFGSPEWRDRLREVIVHPDAQNR